MKVLLDTHILLWAISDDSRLSEMARSLIENEENEIYYSILSIWEVELKQIAHPESMFVTAQELVGYCEKSGFYPVQIKEQHIFELSRLKRDANAPQHKDPFDRLLICQALTENMMLITHDKLIPQYEVPCILAV